jgi:hypothetical protein
MLGLISGPPPNYPRQRQQIKGLRMNREQHKNKKIDTVSEIATTILTMCTGRVSEVTNSQRIELFSLEVSPGEMAIELWRPRSREKLVAEVLHHASCFVLVGEAKAGRNQRRTD